MKKKPDSIEHLQAGEFCAPAGSLAVAECSMFCLNINGKKPLIKIVQNVLRHLSTRTTPSKTKK